ncbi:PREDICTED: putative pectinesterase/pectinesterase inhibitor 38 [Camelina sativa]|uniref:Pectinesterase n=1 Tax=Camelina sativa TaxID=90675 RepID=A0ABM0TI14_CAMSA|nr:PREDICTED: putative pectinesterase/pectinesterase inhibitor 38 [Camelina sativa]
MCDETPHPGECNTLLIEHKPIRSTTQFLQAAVERTLDGAVRAKDDTYSLGPQFGSKQAWEDCMDLYEQTIYRLNQSLLCPKNAYSSRWDVQAWLSTALTNLDTCQEEISELGVSSHSLDSITIDVINALAINKRLETKWKEFGTSKVEMKTAPSITIGEKVDVVVAQDGSGDYKTIQEAVNGAGKRPKGSPRYVIHVKQGVYEEYVTVGIKSNNMMIIGDGIGKTIITGDKSKGRGFSTFKSATFVAEGDGFVGRDMTIRNTAGPEKHQAVALRSDSDMSVFYRCSIEGYQDTLYVHSGRQFFRECDVYGTVDFIFGNAAAFFQNCRIYARNPPSGVNTITAQSRVNPNQTTGIVIHNSVVRGAPGEQLEGVKTYLGRPWRPYARTVVMGTYLDQLIEPKGWMDWGNVTARSTLYYGEYQNSGPGSGTENRVDWPGFHVISDLEEARQFTLPKFIDAALWLPPTKVPFTINL